MQYEIGTKIDLSYLNRNPQAVEEAEQEHRFYEVGERVVFIKLQNA